VIVDLAAEQGGNCQGTEAGKVVKKHGVTFVGYTDLPSRLAKQSSQLYASNLWRLLEELAPKKDGMINVNFEDEVIRGTTVIKAGEITWPPPAPKLSVAPAGSTPATAAKVEIKSSPSGGHGKASAPASAASTIVVMSVAAAFLLLVGQFAPPAFVSQFTVFVLSCFVGYMVVWNVSASLHTPLMSVTNAISGIIALGAIIQIGSDNWVVQVLAAVAVLVATINIAGGFWVTRRMLKMFQRD
jgi:NAD(P) transhydrogenase subunit alpha